MKTKQVNPMGAFVGTGFDCEFDYVPADGKFLAQIGSFRPLIEIDKSGRYDFYFDEPEYNLERSKYSSCRPRLNNPQVLDDYTPILVEGFVWVARTCGFVTGGYIGTNDTYQHATHHTGGSSSSELKKDLDNQRLIEWVAFKGVQQGSQLEDWAIENDVPIYNYDMEVVK